MKRVLELVRKLGLGKIDWAYYVSRYKQYEAEFRYLFLKSK